MRLIGGSWNQTTLPLASGDNFHSDPAVDWTSDGTAWAFTLGISATGHALRSYRSTENGATWTLEAKLSGSQTAVDREVVWVDHSPTSPFKDQIYITWHNGVPAVVAVRTAGAGGSWQAPIQISRAHHINLQRGRLQLARYQRCIQAKESSLEVD